jgi:choline-sulfatase
MAKQPNMLLIMTDQHAPHMAGFSGSDLVDTPSLDALAARSTRFEAAYCQSPLCVPSRTSMLVGKHAYRCSAWDNGTVLFPEHVTLPGWLAKHGYTTAAVGKMHFRGQEQMHGWQHRPYGDLVESKFPFHQPDPPETADGRWNRHDYGRFPNAGPTSIPESLLLDNLVTTESLAWLLEFADRHPERPWFFCASYSRPHFPLTAPGRYVRKYLTQVSELPPLPAGYPEALHPHDRFIVDDFGLTRFPPEDQRRALAAYCACVEFVDDCIGRLLDGLQRARCLDNTCVVYTSDHGDMAAEHGLWWKRTYYEASAGVPLLIAGPDIERGTCISTPVELVDLLPTCCDWAGIATPDGLDGESLTPLLCGQAEMRRKRTARSELLGERPETQFRMLRDGRWKLVEFPNAPPRLFDLESDPEELEDLAADPPPEAPLPEMSAQLALAGTWEQMGVRRASDRRRQGQLSSSSPGAAQYRLADGRILEADAPLYVHERTVPTKADGGATR